MHKKIQKMLQITLFFSAIYLFFDSFIHFFDIKLFNTYTTWPVSAISYARLLDKVSGSFIFMAIIIILVVYRNLDKYKVIVYLSAVWALFLGATLAYLSLSTDYSRDFSFLPSLAFWLPFYRQFLFLEAGCLIFYSILVYLWFRTRKPNE